MQVALGIDASLTSTGLARVDINGKLLSTKAVRVSKTNGDIPRLLAIESEVAQWVKEADLVVLEGYAYGGHHGFSIGELGWAVKRTVYLAGKPLYIVTPAQWRKAILGRGTAPKEIDGKALDKKAKKTWVTNEITKQIDKTFDTTDEAEAAAMALLGRMLLKARNGEDLSNQPKHLTAMIADIIGTAIQGGKQNDRQQRKDSTKSSRRKLR